jgi:hypothetical protein
MRGNSKTIKKVGLIISLFCDKEITLYLKSVRIYKYSVQTPNHSVELLEAKYAGAYPIERCVGATYGDNVL